MTTLLDRFCRYVQVETTAAEDADCYPSSPGQLELGKMLAEELTQLGLADVSMSKHGIVMATIPGNVEGAPTIAWFAHVDTSPEAPGKNIKPVVHDNYDGKDITLPGDPTKVIRVSETVALGKLKGKTIITSDGTTLLGADDKSGVAIIMTTAAQLMSQPDIKHGPIRIVFTCDEEIGHGTDKVDLAEVNAVVGYTLDGEDEGQIENETFSADLAIVTVTGKNIHPGLAKGKMVNAMKVAADFLTRLPKDRLAPEVTEGRDGFVHPYVVSGGVGEVTIRMILRSFETADLANEADLLRNMAAAVIKDHPGSSIDISVTKQYRNMVEALEKVPRAVGLAEQAMRHVGIEPVFESIRGGTDGSRFSELGLPTPNLSAGMHNFHSPLEFACLDQMETAVRVLIELATLWGKEE